MLFKKSREIERLKRENEGLKHKVALLQAAPPVRPPYHKEPLEKVELFASVPTSGISHIILRDALTEAFRKELNNRDLDFETVGLFDGPIMFDQASLTIYMEVDNG